jgi:hypothetical protein
LWGKQLSGKKILFYCANIATVQIIKNGRSKEPLINEIYETFDCVCYVEQLFAIFSDEICYVKTIYRWALV